MTTCLLCKHGTTKPGHVTVTLERDGATVIFKGVPAQVCDNCGEYDLDEETTAELLRRAQDAVRDGAEVEILRYAA